MGHGIVRALGSLLIAVLVGIVVLWIALELFVGALKLLGVAIGIAAMVAVYFVAEKAIGKGR
jgi:putative flippase GtrA